MNTPRLRLGEAYFVQTRLEFDRKNWSVTFSQRS
jgi:hypothetical protein